MRMMRMMMMMMMMTLGLGHTSETRFLIRPSVLLTNVPLLLFLGGIKLVKSIFNS